MGRGGAAKAGGRVRGTPRKVPSRSEGIYPRAFRKARTRADARGARRATRTSMVLSSSCGDAGELACAVAIAPRVVVRARASTLSWLARDGTPERRFRWRATANLVGAERRKKDSRGTTPRPLFGHRSGAALGAERDAARGRDGSRDASLAWNRSRSAPPRSRASNRARASPSTPSSPVGTSRRARVGCPLHG
jgi:hypothetical protein